MGVKMDAEKELKNYVFVILTLAATVLLYAVVFQFAAQYLAPEILVALYVGMQITLSLFWYVDRFRDFSSTEKNIRVLGIILGVICIVYGNFRYIGIIIHKFPHVYLDKLGNVLISGFLLQCMGARLLTIFLSIRNTPR
jgi:NADH:ubiquinone oxidoreductase subunit 6 (subunit J)